MWRIQINSLFLSPPVALTFFKHSLECRRCTNTLRQGDGESGWVLFEVLLYGEMTAAERRQTEEEEELPLLHWTFANYDFPPRDEILLLDIHQLFISLCRSVVSEL